MRARWNATQRRETCAPPCGIAPPHRVFTLNVVFSRLDIIIVGAPRLWHQSRKSLELLCSIMNDPDADHLKHNIRCDSWALDCEENSKVWVQEEGIMVGMTCMMMRHRGKKLQLCVRGGEQSSKLLGPFNKKQIIAAIAAGMDVCEEIEKAGSELPVNWHEDSAYIVNLPEDFKQL